MSQRRVTIFGDLIDTSDMPEVISNIMSAGRLTGNDFIVAASDYMSITAGSCLLPDGVLVVEDEIKSLVIPNSSLATDYTVIYQLEDTMTLGGSPAVLRLLSGVKRQQDFSDGTILGWVRYPGGSVPLSASFFIQPSHLRITKRSDVFYLTQSCPLRAITPPHSIALASSDFDHVANRVTYQKSPIAAGTTVSFTTTGTLPSPLVSTATYYVINSANNSFQLASSLLSTPIDFTDIGSGVHIMNVTSSPWVDTIDYVANEACTRYVNNSSLPSAYTLRLPFVIPSEGQPRKLVTRLLVDFNCLVTFSINLKGTVITLTPNGGLISNTGNIITREFDIPYDVALAWDAGTTAYIEITVDSQPSRGTSIAYVGLTLEPTPFTLFT